MYFDYHDWAAGGHCIGGVASTNDTWYFAEGATHAGFEEYICIQNPGEDVATVSVDYRFDDGTSHVEVVSVEPTSRYTVSVNDDVGAGRNVSAIVESDEPVIAERPMYFDYQGKWKGEHDCAGATRTYEQWYLAEGTTRAGFEEWVTVLNPTEFTFGLYAYYMFTDGESFNTIHTIQPNSRLSINVNETLVGIEKDVSVYFDCEIPVVIERPMYFDYNGSIQGGHDIVGFGVN
jgi:hypothetical protein